MKKLTLDLDRLAIESFETVAPLSARRGTVLGNSYGPSDNPTVCNTMCNWSDAPNISCVETCSATFPGGTESPAVTCFKTCVTPE